MQQDFHAKVSDRVNYDNECRLQKLEQMKEKRPPPSVRGFSPLRRPQHSLPFRRSDQLPSIDKTEKINQRHEKESEFGRRRSVMSPVLSSNISAQGSGDTSYSMDGSDGAEVSDSSTIKSAVSFVKSCFVF
jgi:hypothetical protein